MLKSKMTNLPERVAKLEQAYTDLKDTISSGFEKIDQRLTIATDVSVGAANAAKRAAETMASAVIGIEATQEKTQRQCSEHWKATRGLQTWRWVVTGAGIAVGAIGSAVLEFFSRNPKGHQ